MIWITDDRSTQGDRQAGGAYEIPVQAVSAEFKDVFIASTSSTVR